MLDDEAEEAELLDENAEAAELLADAAEAELIDDDAEESASSLFAKPLKTFNMKTNHFPVKFGRSITCKSACHPNQQSLCKGVHFSKQNISVLDKTVWCEERSKSFLEKIICQSSISETISDHSHYFTELSKHFSSILHVCL